MRANHHLSSNHCPGYIIVLRYVVLVLVLEFLTIAGILTMELLLLSICEMTHLYILIGVFSYMYM